MPLNEVLNKRRSMRTFAPTPLTQQEISQLLWSAQGITNSIGSRTAPSANAKYYLHIFLATSEGVFEYLPAGHSLRKLSSNDVRQTVSGQPQVKGAPDVFIVTGEFGRAAEIAKDDGARLVNLEAGHATENMLLEAVSLGLGAVSVGGIDPKQVQNAASLPKDRVAIYLVPVGHPRAATAK
jgi:SagB-type dehydrogenase family enzyme